MTQALATLSRLAEGDTLTKAERLDLYKLAAGLGVASSIHARVYDWWAEINQDLFDGQLDPCLIVIGVTEHSGCLGLCSMVGGQARITLHQALIYPANTEADERAIKHNSIPTRWGMPKAWMGEQMLRDVLLHEMLHQAQAQLITDPIEKAAIQKDAHHCQSWADLCNRAAAYLNLDTHFTHYKRGKTSLKDGGRKNIQRPVSEECPEGKRLAEFDEVSSFPHLSFQKEGKADSRYGS